MKKLVLLEDSIRSSLVSVQNEQSLIKEANER